MLSVFLLVYYMSCATCSDLLSRPRRSWIIDSFAIEEGHPGPFPYVLGKIDITRDYRVYFDLFGEGVDEKPEGVLSIDKESGTLSVHRAVDYEEKTKLKLRFEAKKTDSSIDTKLGIEISIQDINDNPPRFQRELYEVIVDEENGQGSHLLMVVAYDRDQRGTPNSTFHYEIKSVSPNPPDTEFFIDESGTISFKGCLDHEVVDMFTVVVEAKDHGDVVSLSSSTTVVIHVKDSNNHLPTISGQTGSGKVKEHEVGASPLRLHVTDKDTPNSTAWRVRYTIQGDKGGHFKIETDPDTNDGILTVVEPFDFEEGAQTELSISVENEAPYFSCKVKERTSSGLWRVDTNKGGDDPGAGQPHSVNVIIGVEDTNDPPVFSVSIKETQLEENAPVGTWVEKVTAVDPDSSHAKDFVYKIGNDPAGWVTVDPHTGDITIANTPDRESPHVVDGVYTILVYAVDNGEPPMTGTATVNIHVNDQNDNMPRPTVDIVDVCASDGPSTANITAFDLDENPFGGPFTFELLGDVQGKWKLSPSYGYTAGLVKEPGVYAGPHTIDLKISDLQGEFDVYQLSVTVCECSAAPNCRRQRDISTKASFGTVGVVFASLFLLLFLLLMAVTISCKKEFATLQTDDSSGETLLTSNIEKPGTDCQVHYVTLAVSTDEKHHNASDWRTLHDGMQQVSTKGMEQNVRRKNLTEDYRRENVSYLFSENWNQMTWEPLIANGYHHTHQIEDMSARNVLHKMNSSSQANGYHHTHQIEDMSARNVLHKMNSGSQTNGYHHTHQIEDMSTRNVRHKMNSGSQADAALHALLDMRLSSLWKKEDSLDYHPHLYTDEGDCDLQELDIIPIPDDDSFQKQLEDLGPKFNQLASICKPPPIQN